MNKIWPLVLKNSYPKITTEAGNRSVKSMKQVTKPPKEGCILSEGARELKREGQFKLWFENYTHFFPLKMLFKAERKAQISRNT